MPKKTPPLGTKPPTKVPTPFEPLWKKLSVKQPIPHERSHHTAVWTDSEGMIVFGGEFTGDNDRHRDMWRFDGSAWSAVHTDDDSPGFEEPAKRNRHAAAWDIGRGRLLVFGGRADSSRSNDLWEATLSWNELVANAAPSAPPPRFGGSVAWRPAGRSSGLYLFGGDDANDNPLNDLRLYKGGSWSVIHLDGATGAPLKRMFHTAVWDTDKDRMLVFGGRVKRTPPHGPRHELLSYDPATGGVDGWTVITSEQDSGGAGDRSEHAAAWDPQGKRLLVHGGRFGIEDTSIRGDLWQWTAAHGWKKLKGDPAPTSPLRRYGHSAVWDSQHGRLLLFGGRNGSVHFNDVWSYG
jgi:hypothetical protein